MRRTFAVLVALVALVFAPSAARAEPDEVPVPHFHDARVQRFATNLALFALSGATALAGFSRRPPLSLVMVAWPTIAPKEDASPRDRVATWTVPAGGRRPMFYATFVDVRF
ncbi:MAG TPA: hypothetical protein VIF62_25910 [Labilithrix sp.]